MHSNDLMNNKVVFDMATNSKSWGEFAGKPGDNVEQWAERVKMIRYCSGLDERSLVGMTLASLRGEAEAWASEHWSRLIDLPVDSLLGELVRRFTNSKETAEVVSRFFTTGPSKTYAAYMNLLADATTCFRRGCINSEPLIKQVIVRSPGDIKSMLLQAASDSLDWTAFVTKAEEAAWIAFPEKVVNEVTTHDTQDIGHAQVEAISTQGFIKYCRLHGNGSHFTVDCEVVKLVESKGWRRGRQDRGDQKNINKNRKDYMVYSAKEGCSGIEQDGFRKEIMIGTKKGMVLLDTGADVSLMRREYVPVRVTLAPVQMNLRSVTGAPIKAVGQAWVDFKIGDVMSKANFLITECTPADHILLGCDWICACRSLTSNTSFF
ncbi:hypothetical protein PAPHI01_2044 [Pancytospora philotis]|nr:hypothetical protein PAPHI01_2044 [Pancytospora philotis]